MEGYSGNYITPLFEEKFEDVVWSVEIHWQGVAQRVFLYILREFQSSVDRTMHISQRSGPAKAPDGASRDGDQRSHSDTLHPGGASRC
ncbi:hypothetical protein [Billgrantia endophytica]|uniref:Uncharacterized protein n=1 Tax=Billgrantia endophytica TaxID=2033802 RepID=A0A2N7TX20_9GAMM|nr:hypothetical protein [Halomonas endophytica]PMR72720.1 hypothetical protein C1H69_19930 [Halomonas endophytica]